MLDEDRPNTLGFADGTMLSVEEVEEINKLTEDLSLPIYCNLGDIAVINNYMWMHARLPYTLKPNQKRELGVMLLEHQKRNRMIPGTWGILDY